MNTLMIWIVLAFMAINQNEPSCVKVAEVQPDEGETRVEYTDPQGRELCRLKIFLHDRTVLGFAPPGGEHDGYAAAFNGAHVTGHRTDPNVDLISHAQVFAVANSVTVTPTQPPPTDTEVPTMTPSKTSTPPDNTPTWTLTTTPITPTWTATVGTGTHLPPTLIPPVENPTVTPTVTDTPTVDIYYPPPEEGKSPPSPRLPETGMNGSNQDRLNLSIAVVFLFSIALFFFLVVKMLRRPQ